jgi:glutaredoxin
LVNAIAPGSAPDHNSLDPAKKKENNQRGIDLAYKLMDIPPIVEASDLANPRVDEQSVMAYISYFRNAEPKKEVVPDAHKCRGYGYGLVDGVVNELSEFAVDAPNGNGKLEVRVEGPKSNAQVNIDKKQNPDGTVSYKVSYTPKEPGAYKVHVTLDGVHIPGSTFHVNVLEAVSLGGEGKIRVFYSTTASTDKGRSDVLQLQRLLEAKKIHERPDFEPWIPVDIMDKPDREAVFKKAGTRALPIVFIDDKYAGDYDKLCELEESGQLNVLLNYHTSRQLKI